jgi:hypothetical protein
MTFVFTAVVGVCVCGGGGVETDWGTYVYFVKINKTVQSVKYAGNYLLLIKMSREIDLYELAANNKRAKRPLNEK